MPAAPDEIAAGIVFLASDDARVANGVIPAVGGGLAASNGQPNFLALSGQGLSARFGSPLAAEYGWIYRAIPDGELNAFDGSLARRIARLAPGVIEAAKTAVDAMSPPMLAEIGGLRRNGAFATRFR